MTRRIVAVVVVGVLSVGAVIYAVADRERRLTAVSVMSGLGVTYLLTPARVAQIPHTLGGDFDVISPDSVLLLARDALLSVADTPSGLVVRRLTDGVPPESFAWDGAHSALLTLSGGYLGQLNADGQTGSALPVPSGSRLAPSSRPGVVYLHGGESAGGRRLYVFRENGAYEILLELPDSIGAVADNAAATYVLAGESIYRIGSEGVRRVVALNANELGGPVTSISVDRENTLFFATSRQVFALRGAAALTIVNDAGGALRTYGDRLFVWDSTRLILFSVGPLGALAR